MSMVPTESQHLDSFSLGHGNRALSQPSCLLQVAVVARHRKGFTSERDTHQDSKDLAGGADDKTVLLQYNIKTFTAGNKRRTSSGITLLHGYIMLVGYISVIRSLLGLQILWVNHKVWRHPSLRILIGKLLSSFDYNLILRLSRWNEDQASSATSPFPSSDWSISARAADERRPIQSATNAWA
ncbi:hypothetical protein CSKR_100672 [Clonorchis sinensis]|uniref:Uncharacterized protein n=1 Tax=Clonorchis sinensis TaxID=79923 RepID=A0A419PFV9_CLOSI|nr:hypothetical protein CSKR_100672 [Clonorchis sinensis]